MIRRLIISGMIISGMIIPEMIIPDILRAQTPRDARTAAAPAPAGTGAISGTVTADASNRPVRYAAVVLIGSTTGTLRVTSTNADGHFDFAALPADRYLVGASKTPYLGAVAGARRPARPGPPVALADGQKITDVAIRLPMGATIAGTITDERGQPAAGASVTVQRWKIQNGESTLVNAGPYATADDQGRYRIFGLAPGEYVVSAFRNLGPGAGARTLTDADVDRALKAAGQATAPPPQPPADPGTRYAPVFYPGTTRANDAALIALNAGDERTGTDFGLQLIPVVKIDGSVASSDGTPIAGAVNVVLAMMSGPLQSASLARTTPDGRFTFSNVMPGSYSITARTVQPIGAPGRGASSPPGAPVAAQVGSATVDVAGADVSGLQITLRPPLTIAGHLAFHSTTATAPSGAGRSVPIRSMASPSGPGANPNASAADANGAFTISNVTPGRYLIGGPLFFGANADSITWSLESVVVDGQNLTDLPLEIGEQPPRDIVVTYTDTWQQVTGRLTTAAGVPATDYVIVIFPANRAYWMQGSRRILTAHPGTDGRFTISGPGPSTLPPGDYLLAAVTDLDRDEQFDPSLLSTLMAGAVPVTVHAGDRKAQDLVVK